MENELNDFRKEYYLGENDTFSPIFFKERIPFNIMNEVFILNMFQSTVSLKASQCRLAAIIPIINPLNHLQFTKENLRLNDMMQQKNEILRTQLRKKVDNT